MIDQPVVPIVPINTPSPNPVEAALNSGLAAVKTRPWLLCAPQTFLLPLRCLILPTIVVGVPVLIFRLAERPSDGAVVASVVALMISLPLLLLIAIASTGYAAVALRVVRGESARVRDLFAGFGRVPGIVLATIITGAGVAAILGAYAIGALLLAKLSGMGARVLIGDPQVAILVSDGLSYGLGAALLVLAIVAVGYLLAGLAQWPYLLLADGLGAKDAVVASWKLMRGRRLSLVSLCFATTALDVVGVLAFGFGAIFTMSIAAATFAAFYDRLDAAEFGEAIHNAPMSAPRSPMAAWAVDGWIALRVTALFTLASLVASVAPTIALIKTTWLPYGPVWSLVGLTSLIVVPVAYLAIGRAMGRTPGQRIVDAGWGRFRWLAAVLGVAVLVEVATLAWTSRNMPTGILSTAVGYETARHIVAELPVGYDSAANNQGASDRLDLPSTTPSDMIISASYRVTDTAGSPYYFAMRRYFHADTAQAAATRMRAAGAMPAAELGSDAFTTRDEDAGVTRIVARDGDTVIAGEASPEHLDELKRLMAKQFDRLDAARAEVDRAYRSLPVPEERLTEKGELKEKDDTKGRSGRTSEP